MGGTGLYLRALLDGLFDSSGEGASSDEAYRQKLLAEQEKHGGRYLHDQLKKVDPASAAKIHANDIRRLVRALEVFHLTKKPMSEQKHLRRGIRHEYDVRVYFLNRDRQDLYERINQRVEAMLKEGLENEVKRLLKKNMSKTAAMALGFRQMKARLAGQISAEEALRLIKRDTRHYAKRQIAWFKREKDVCFIEVAKNAKARDIAAAIAEKFKERKAGNS